MKKIFQFIILLIFSVNILPGNAQSAFTFEASQLYTSFKYADSQGTQLNNEYSGVFNTSYRIGFLYTTNFGLLLHPGIGMRNCGADMVYDDMNYSWQLRYADVKMGIGYIYKINKIHPYFMASGYYSYLLQGSQILNNEHFNITESELIKNNDYGVIFAPGVKFDLTDNFSTYLELNYLMGLNNLEIDESQEASNIAYGITLGLSFSLTKD